MDDEKMHYLPKEQAQAEQAHLAQQMSAAKERQHPFETVAPTPGQAELIADLRRAYGHLFNVIEDVISPYNPYLRDCVRALEESSMWLTKAITHGIHG